MCVIRGAAGEHCLFPNPGLFFFFFLDAGWRRSRAVVSSGSNSSFYKYHQRSHPSVPTAFVTNKSIKIWSKKKIIFKRKLGRQRNSTVKTPCRRGRRRQTQTDFQGQPWLLVNVCVRCSVSFSHAAAILCSKSVPFRTFIKDPPVLCRGFYWHDYNGTDFNIPARKKSH